MWPHDRPARPRLSSRSASSRWRLDCHSRHSRASHAILSDLARWSGSAGTSSATAFSRSFCRTGSFACAGSRSAGIFRRRIGSIVCCLDAGRDRARRLARRELGLAIMPWCYSVRSICCCASVRRTSPLSDGDPARPGLAPSGEQHRRRPWSRQIGRWRAPCVRTFWWIALAISHFSTPGTPCRCTRPSIWSRSASRRCRRPGRSAWSAWSASGQIIFVPSRIASGANGLAIGCLARHLFRRAHRLASRREPVLVYAMILAQDFSVTRQPPCLSDRCEIFEGRIWRDLRTVMVARSAAARPSVITGLLSTRTKLHRGVLDRAGAQHRVGAGDLPRGARKVRLVADSRKRKNRAIDARASSFARGRAPSRHKAGSCARRGCSSTRRLTSLQIRSPSTSPDWRNSATRARAAWWRGRRTAPCNSVRRYRSLGRS